MLGFLPRDFSEDGRVKGRIQQKGERGSIKEKMAIIIKEMCIKHIRMCEFNEIFFFQKIRMCELNYS